MDAELEKEICMTYNELCHYLQEKYGLAKVDYFPNEECKKKNQYVSRTSEGLLCHHNCEDVYSNACVPQLAKSYPFSCQKKENLSYCNYIEHLLLHLKINTNVKTLDIPQSVVEFIQSGGFYTIVQEINTLFYHNGSTQAWRNRCFELIKDKYNDYCNILQAILCYLREHYTGVKDVKIQQGIKYKTEIYNTTDIEDIKIDGQITKKLRIEYEIIEENKEKNYIIVSNGDRKSKVTYDSICKYITLECALDALLVCLATTTDGQVNEDILKRLKLSFTDEAKHIAERMT